MLCVKIPGTDAYSSLGHSHREGEGEPPLKLRKAVTLGPYPMAARLEDSVSV